MIITEVRKLSKNYQVTFDNGYKLTIDEDTLVQFKLRPGINIDSVDDILKSVKHINYMIRQLNLQLMVNLRIKSLSI